jgi:hypothetical protein
MFSLFFFLLTDIFPSPVYSDYERENTDDFLGEVNGKLLESTGSGGGIADFGTECLPVYGKR